MAFRKEKHRILSGSLNLLPPGDLIPEEDSVRLENWRVDQAGQLRSRSGMEHLSGFLADGPCRSLYRSGSTRYAGIGTKLYRSSGAGGYFEIGSGFDGRPLGLASFADGVWIMNQGAQKLHVEPDAGVRDWTPVAPTQAATAAAGATTSKTVATFDFTAVENWSTINADGDAISTQFDLGNKIEGNAALHIEAYPAGTWRVEHTGEFDDPHHGPLDLSLDGLQRDEDEFRIWVWTTDPSAVQEITLAFDVNTGDYDLDTYSVAIPGSRLNPAASSWTELRVRRGLNPSGILASDSQYVETLRRLNASEDDLERAVLEQALSEIKDRLTAGTLGFIRQGSTAGKDWTTIASTRVQARVSAGCDLLFDNWTVTGGALGALDGVYTWYATYDTIDGHETNAGPASNELTVRKEPAMLTAVPVSPDAQVTRRHIYRAGGALDGIYRVGTIENNTATTYTDSLSDEDAQTRHTLLPLDHDPPPAALGVARVGGRLLAWNSAAHPARYWWTPNHQPWFFPGSTDEEEGNWQDAGDPADGIQVVTEHKGAGWIYKERSIWRLGGDPDRTDPVQTNADFGAWGQKCVANAGAVDYVGGGVGIYRFNGDYGEKISTKIDPLFKGQYVEISPGQTAAPMNMEAAGNSCLEFAQGRIYFSYPEGGSTYPDRMLVCEVDTLRWTTYRLDPALSPAGAFSALHYEGAGRDFTAGITHMPGAAEAAIYKIETGATDDGVPVELAWVSRFHDQGLPDDEKTYADLVIVYRTAVLAETPSTLTVKLYYDDGTTVDALGSISSSTWARKVFRINSGVGRRGFNAAVSIEGSATSTCIIRAAYLHWYAEARKGRSFDSGVTDLGSARVKQIDKLEFEIEPESAGTLSWSLYGDLPGGSIALRLSGTAAIAAARKVLPVTLASALEGHKLRLLATADVEFRMHGVRVRALEIGEYVDGAQGDVWESKEVNYGGG